MPLVNMNHLFPEKPEKICAVGAFNVHNLEFIKGVIAAAEAQRAPVILALGMMSIKYIGFDTLAEAAISAAEKADVPVAVHLDHAREIDVVARALDLGLSSVMFDGSSLPYEENLKKTKQVSAMAHAAGATAEGEVGVLSSVEKSQARPTDPDQAVAFAAETGVDYLAVSIGSVHGMKTQEAGLDLDLLKRLSDKLSCPMVLHGASGVKDDAIRAAIQGGIRKVNVNTGLKVAFINKVQAVLKDNPDMDLLGAFTQGMGDIQAAVAKKIRLFGSDGTL